MDANRLIRSWAAWQLLAVEPGLEKAAQAVPYGYYPDAWGELLCGVALLAGFLTRLSAVAMIVIQFGAIGTVTWARGFSSAQGAGYEYNLVIIGACLALVLAGSGPLAVDRRLLRWWQQRGQATTAAHQPVAVG